MRFCHEANANRAGFPRQRMCAEPLWQAGNSEALPNGGRAKNRAWSSGQNRGNCMCSLTEVTRGAGKLACLHRVCYKFVANSG